MFMYGFIICLFIVPTIYFSASQNAELFALTYGALVAQMVKDHENVEDVNRQLDRMGYNIGVRLIEDFSARQNLTGRCVDLHDTAEKIRVAFQMYGFVANDSFLKIFQFLCIFFVLSMQHGLMETD